MTRNIRIGAKTSAARRMRKALTKPELWLWLRLKRRQEGLPVFRNQHPYGPYILDFFCPEARLCIEVDGIEHTEDQRQVRDTVREKWLADEKVFTHRVIARDLLADPDATAQGVIDLAIERVAMLGAAAHGPAPPTA